MLQSVLQADPRFTYTECKRPKIQIFFSLLSCYQLFIQSTFASKLYSGEVLSAFILCKLAVFSQLTAVQIVQLSVVLCV